ncbi:MAG: hypothetical protein MHPSP_001617, partial [Paramarteilia canceri]
IYYNDEIYGNKETPEVSVSVESDQLDSSIDIENCFKSEIDLEKSKNDCLQLRLSFCTDSSKLNMINSNNKSIDTAKQIKKNEPLDIQKIEDRIIYADIVLKSISRAEEIGRFTISLKPVSNNLVMELRTSPCTFYKISEGILSQKILNLLNILNLYFYIH